MIFSETFVSYFSGIAKLHTREMFCNHQTAKLNTREMCFFSTREIKYQRDLNRHSKLVFFEKTLTAKPMGDS